MYHKLGDGPVADEVVALRVAVAKAVADPKNGALTVGLDAIAGLEAPILNGLIAALRQLRNAGATVRLHVTRHDLLRTLDVTGLDRVFEVIERVEEQSPAPVRKRAPRKGNLAGGMAALVAAVLVVASSFAAFAQGTDADATPQQVVAKLIERNPELRSFQSHVDVRMHTGIPFLNPALEGTTYFKKPGNYEVVFTKVPSYARGVEKLYTDIGDPAGWEGRFVLTLAGQQAYNGHHDLVLRMVQRVRGMIDHEDVLIDPQAWTIDKMTYFYYNGGVIALEQTYRSEGGFSVLSDQHATIELPHLPKAVANAHYSSYRLNVAVDDTVFTERQTKEMGTGK